MDWESEELQKKMREFERGESFWEHVFDFALRDAKKLGKEKELREAVRKGVKVRIQKIRQGSEGDSFITGKAIEMFSLEEERASFEEAVTENCKIKLSEVIEVLKKDRVHTSDYRFHRDHWKQIVEKVPQLKGEFEKTLLAYRKRHGLVDYERIDEKIEKLAKEYKVSVKRWWREEDEIVIWIDAGSMVSGSGIIIAKVMENHSKEIEYYEYTPEDMAEPLEAYQYIAFGGEEEELEKIFKEAGDIRKEIETANEKLRQKIFEAAGL